MATKKAATAKKATSTKATPKKMTLAEVEKKIKSGNLTKAQAIKLRQQYMDSLNYK